MVDVFDRNEISFVAMTQQFDTTTSMGRLTLNVLLQSAQFERDVTGTSIRNKVATFKRKGSAAGRDSIAKLCGTRPEARGCGRGRRGFNISLPPGGISANCTETVPPCSMAGRE